MDNEKQEKEQVMWTLIVPRHLDNETKKAVMENSHISKSEFIRDAVRKELARRNKKNA